MPGLLLRRSSSKSRPSNSSASPSPSSSPPPTLYRRRIMSRSNTASSPAASAAAFPPAAQASHARAKAMGKDKGERECERPPQDDDEIAVTGTQESDVECWLRMLALQREFHCYNSARLEAAVEALERGCRIEEVAIPSRLCLNLLNEDLRAHMPELAGAKAA